MDHDHNKGPARDTPEPPSDLAARILADNRQMHDAPGYPEFYDRYVGLISNPWEQRRFQQDLARIAARLPPGFRALDLGCGTGNLTLKLLALGANVTGVDLSEAMLDRLRRKAAEMFPSTAENRLRLHNSSIEDYCAHNSDSFDLVCGCSVLHHLSDYASAVRLAARLVAPNGCFYFAHEPVPRGTANLRALLLEWLDFKLQRLQSRLRLSKTVSANDPYYSAESLADYWVDRGGIDPDHVKYALADLGFDVETHLYDSKRHRTLHWLSELLKSRHLLGIEAWRL